MIQSVLVTKLPEEVKEDNDGQREESEGGEEKEQYLKKPTKNDMMKSGFFSK